MLDDMTYLKYLQTLEMHHMYYQKLSKPYQLSMTSLVYNQFQVYR
ncbi:unnamed protein product [Schistosoma curassoni]|uniref:Uncharacterized protein n=1 Tax=Schistosoma curassoni TaxID=6186 RepID=A0A183JUR3_9TREM|nr:unnamed protein product [Schistosoma curassoni]